MVDDRRLERNETVREWIDQGARCPFCASLRLDVDPAIEPSEFMRVNCLTCGYISFFDPAKFGPPSR
jgi:hypothetical protein